ncbi:MAG: hypothetical protein NT091_04680 [Candidatus Falkowbacteria bacterium]|nr:hypothetical protein [Candidatus Falkowbacteria bacterium]
MDNINPLCLICHQSILEKYYFCPNCGNSLKEKSIRVSIVTQIGLYTLAILMPPLGLWPGIKYLIKKDSQAKRIGIILIILTIISTIITIWTFFQFFNNYLDQLNGALL